MRVSVPFEFDVVDVFGIVAQEPFPHSLELTIPTLFLSGREGGGTVFVRTRAGALVTKTVLFVTEGSGRSGSATGGGNKLRAFNKATGAVLAEFVLPDHATGVPMTYAIDGKQYVVVAVGSSPAQFVAFSLPS